MKKTMMVLISLALVVFSAKPALAGLPPLPPLPQMSKDYDALLGELSKEGYGKYKTEPNKPLALPTVENPTGWGTSAKALFEQQFGDLWSLYQLNKCGDIDNPGGFDKQGAKDLYLAVQSGDATAIANAFENGLNWSVGWDLDAIKASFPKLSINKDAWLSGVKPPVQTPPNGSQNQPEDNSSQGPKRILGISTEGVSEAFQNGLAAVGEKYSDADIDKAADEVVQKMKKKATFRGFVGAAATNPRALDTPTLAALKKNPELAAYNTVVLKRAVEKWNALPENQGDAGRQLYWSDGLLAYVSNLKKGPLDWFTLGSFAIKEPK